MKINKGGSQTPVGGTDEASGADKTSGIKPSESTFAQKLDKAAGVPPSSSTGSGVGARPLTGDIGNALENREITAEAAVDQVMSRILDSQMGRQTPAATRAQVETALREALDSDPVLSAKLKTLAD